LRCSTVFGGGQKNGRFILGQKDEAPCLFRKQRTQHGLQLQTFPVFVAMPLAPPCFLSKYIIPWRGGLVQHF
jgi:hypothetical protein